MLGELRLTQETGTEFGPPVMSGAEAESEMGERMARAVLLEPGARAKQSSVAEPSKKRRV